jgi:CMP-N,N'-diacetyllegionaminic acid synthase
MILAVIPARSGSRGVPGKNLRTIHGVPMIAYTIRAALGARRIDRTVVSTDDPTIASLARELGAEAPFLRPDDLSRDTTPTLPVIDHAVRALEAMGDLVSLVVTLQPTSPLRGSDLIDQAIDLLEARGARSAVAVARLGIPGSIVGVLREGWFHRLPASSDGDLRRQAAAPAARITGSVYVTTRDLLAEGRLLDDAPAALLTEGPATLDVDDARDLRAVRRAERLQRSATAARLESL